MVHAPREVVTSIMVVSVGEIVLALILVRLILIVNRGVGTLIHGPRTSSQSDDSETGTLLSGGG